MKASTPCSTQRKRPGPSRRDWMNRQSDQSEMDVLACSGATKMMVPDILAGGVVAEHCPLVIPTNHYALDRGVVVEAVCGDLPRSVDLGGGGAGEGERP